MQTHSRADPARWGRPCFSPCHFFPFVQTPDFIATGCYHDILSPVTASFTRMACGNTRAKSTLMDLLSPTPCAPLPAPLLPLEKGPPLPGLLHSLCPACGGCVPPAPLSCSVPDQQSAPSHVFITPPPPPQKSPPCYSRHSSNQQPFTPCSYNPKQQKSPFPTHRLSYLSMQGPFNNTSLFLSSYISI